MPLTKHDILLNLVQNLLILTIYFRPTGGSNVFGARRYKPDQLTEAVSTAISHKITRRLPPVGTFHAKMDRS